MKCFLSHSSADKLHYVTVLANKLGDRAIYDGYSFEAGKKTWDEIEKHLNKTDIFVILLSDTALESKWVKKEIFESARLLKAGHLKRFVPIIIDPSINHRDKRIPKWLRDNYNLRVVPRPNAAFRIINSSFSQLSIENNARSTASDKLFVGRNDQLKELESRLDDFEKELPPVIVASGLREIGRKAFLIHAMRKANKIDRHHDPITLSLHHEDGIDGFISKVVDLGFSTIYDANIDLSVDYPKKIDIVYDLLNEIVSQNEILLIDDWRCLVQFGGTYADWFVEACGRLPNNRICLCVASASSPNARQYRHNHTFFHIRVPELSADERLGLLVRYLRERGSDNVAIRDLGRFKPILNGYPEQAIFAGDMIRASGIEGALDNSSEIVEFARIKASVYIERYRDDSVMFDLLTFMSWFEFVSVDLITRLGIRTNEDLIAIINEFIEAGLCHLIGMLGEYVRLNDVIRDYVARGSIKIPDRYASVVQEISKDLFSSDDFGDFDYSEKAVAVRVALLEGREVPERLLIPAHFLSAISQNYKNKRYKDVVTLSERALERGNMEDYMRKQILHTYCMALARRRDTRFLNEVQQITGHEHDYVLGFYYRLNGRYDDAISRFEKAINDKRWEENSKREIVLIYNILENYDAAFGLAKSSYYLFPSNPITVLAYFEVLLNKHRNSEGDRSALVSEMEITLQSIERVASEKAEEVKSCMSARYEYYVKGDGNEALRIIDAASVKFPNSPYPLFVKMEIGMSLKQPNTIDDALSEFRCRSFDDKQGATQVKKAELFRVALNGDRAKAAARVERELSYLHEDARERFKQRILALAVDRPRI